MAFSDKVKEDALVACGRHCCICRKFCGNNIEVHHIKPHAEGGSDSFENAIPLCFDCHAEVGQYNSNHPKGTKFTERELRRHRDNCYKIYSGEKTCCEIKTSSLPGIFSVAPPQYLYRITLGQELSSQLHNKFALGYCYDEPSTEEQRKLITEFSQFMIDCIDLVDFNDVSQKMEIDNELNKYIRRLDENNYSLFIASEIKELRGGNEPPMRYPVLNVAFKMKTSDEILQIDSLEVINNESVG